MTEREELLSTEALTGVRVAISASESEDLPRLGLFESHFRLALGEIARSVILSGGMIGYGGHLEPEGYTVLLIQELHRYSRRDRPLRVYLAWPEHRRLPLSQLAEENDELGLYGEILCLDSAGHVIEQSTERGEAAVPIKEPDAIAASLTAMRHFVAHDSSARVLIGGRRTGFQGKLPGLLEEALLSIKLEQPLYLAGGFGGVTSDIAQALGIDKNDWLPPLPDAALDSRLGAGLAELHSIAGSKQWRGPNNGLSNEENRRLARTPRPSEIAALVSLGLGRRFAT